MAREPLVIAPTTDNVNTSHEQEHSRRRVGVLRRSAASIPKERGVQPHGRSYEGRLSLRSRPPVLAIV